jgi:hypothetical protein
MLATASGLASRTPASSYSPPGIGNGIRRLGFSAGWAFPGYSRRALFRAAVSLSLGTLVLLDAGLYSLASSRQPSGGSIGAILGSCIEGNRRAWGGLMNSVDDGFE